MIQNIFKHKKVKTIFIKKIIVIVLTSCMLAHANDQLDGVFERIELRINASTRLPMHAAVADNCLSDMLLLYANGLSVNAISESNVTPLHIAALNGNTHMADWLIHFGAEVNARSFHVSPLHLAVAYRHYELARTLLCNGAQPSAWLMGYLSLHFAVLNNDIPMARLLLSYGASPLARWRGAERYMDKLSPIAIAYRCNNDEMLRILQTEAVQYAHIQLVQRNPRIQLDHEFVRTLSLFRSITDDASEREHLTQLLCQFDNECRS